MIKIVVYDTEKDEALALRECVKDVCRNMRINFQLSTYFSSSKAIIEILKNNIFEYDILCLSINDKDNHAFDIAEQVRQKNDYSAIVFISATGDRVFDVFKYRAWDYFFKPLSKDILSATLHHVIRDLKKNKNYFTIKSKEILARIPYNSIDYFESRLKNVKMVLNDEKLEEKVFAAKLDDVHNSLPQSSFIRCHQSYIINLDNVRYLDRAQKKFILHSGREVFISKRNYPGVLNEFINYQNRSSNENVF